VLIYKVRKRGGNMKTLMALTLLIGSMNVMAFSMDAEKSFAGETICSDRSVGKGAVEGNGSSDATSSETAVSN
jgi:hypothetical protein